MEFVWLPECEAHCRKHQKESPEICPEFIEQLMTQGAPSRHYADKAFAHRYIFEAYFPPEVGRPYRVVFEVSDQQAIIPVACWRIKDRDFSKVQPRKKKN